MTSDGPYPSPAASVRTFPSDRHDRHDRHDHPPPNGPSLPLPRPPACSSTYPPSLRPSLLIPRRTSLSLAAALPTPTSSLDVRPIPVSSIQPTLFNVNPSRLGKGTNPFDLLNEHKFDRFVEGVTETIRNVLRGPEAETTKTKTMTMTMTMTRRDRDVFGAVERIEQQGPTGNDDAEQDDQQGIASPPSTANRPLFLHETSEEYESSSGAPRHSADPVLGEQDQEQPRQNGEMEVIELGSSSDEQDEEEEEEEEQDGSYDEESVNDDRSSSEQVAEEEWMNEAPRPSQLERHLGSEGSSRSVQRGREVDREEEDEEDGEEDDDEEEDEEDGDGEEDEEEEEDEDDEVDEEEEARDDLRDDEMEQHVQEQDQEEDEEELLDPQTAFALSMPQITRVDAQGDEVDSFVEILEEEFEVDAVDDDGGVLQPNDDDGVDDEQVDDDEEGTPPLPPSMAEAFRNARSGELWDPMIKGPSLLVQEPEYNDDDAEDEEILGSRIPAYLKGKGRAPTPSTQSPTSAGSIFDSEGGNGSLEPEDDGEDYDDEEDDDLDSLVNFQVEDLPDMTLARLTKLMKTLQEMYDSACRQQDEETVRWVEDKWEVVKEAWMEKGGELSSDGEGEEGEDDGEEVDGGHFDQEDDESEQVENEDDGSADQDRIENLALQMLERYAQGQDQEVRVDVKAETQRIVQEMIDEEDGQEGSGLAQAYQDESGPDESVDEDVDAEQTEDYEMAFTGHQYRPPTPDEDDAVPAQSTTFDNEAVMGVPTLGATESTEGNWLAILQDQIQAQAATDAEATVVEEQAALGFAPPLSAEVGRFSNDDRMDEDGDDELEEEAEDDDVQILSPVDLMSSSPTPSHEEQDEDAIPQELATLPREEVAPLMGYEESAAPGSEQSAELGQDAQFVVLEEKSTDGGMAEASNEIALSEVPQDEDENSTPAPPRIRNVIELGEWDPSSPIRFDTTLPSPSTKTLEVISSSDVLSEPQSSHVGMDAALRAALALPAATLEEQFGGAAAESAATSTLETASVQVPSPEAEALGDSSQQHFSGLGNIWAQFGVEAPRASMETTFPVQPAQQETAQNLSTETQPTSEQTITTDAALTEIDVTMPPSSASLDALLDYVQVSDVAPTGLDTSPDVTPGISLQTAHVEAGPSTTAEVFPSTPKAGPSDSTASVVRATPPSNITIGGVQVSTGLLTPDPDGYDRVPSHEDEEGEIEGEEEMQGQEDPFVEAPPDFEFVEETEQTIEATEAPDESMESVAAEVPTELEHAPEPARESSIIDEHDLAFFKARHHSEHLVIVDDDESIPTMSANVSVISSDEEDEVEVEVDIEVEDTAGGTESIDIDRAFKEIVASSPLKQSLPSDLDLGIGYRMQEDEFAGQALVRAGEEAEPALPTSEVPSRPAGEDEIPQDKALDDEAPSDEHLAEEPAAIEESSNHEAETPAPDDPGKLESLSFDAEEYEDPTLTESFFPGAPDVIEAEEGVKELLESGRPLRSTTPDYEPFTTTPEAEPFEYDGVEEGAEFFWDGVGDLEPFEEEVGHEVVNSQDEEHDFDLDAPLPTVEDPWTPEAEANIDEAASSSDSEADEAVEEMLLSEADYVVQAEGKHTEEKEDELHSVAATEDDAESVHVHFESPVVPQEEELDAIVVSASQDEPAHVEAEAVEMDDGTAVETSAASPQPPVEIEESSAANTKRRRSARSRSPAKRARTITPEYDATQSPRRISARLHPEALLPPVDISVPIPTLGQTPRLVTPDPTSQEPAVELTPRRSERNLRRSASVVTLREPSPLPAVAAVEASAVPETDPSTPSSVRRSTRHTTPGSTATSKKRRRSDAEPEPVSEERGGTLTSVTNSPAGGPKRRRGTPAPVSVAVETPTTTPDPIAPHLHHHSSSSTIQRDEETMVDHPTTRAHCPFVQLEVQSREYPSAPPVVVNIPSVGSFLRLSRFLALADLCSLSPKCALSIPLAQETLRTFPIRQIDQLPPHPTLDDSVLRLGGQGHTTSTSHDPLESGSTHLSIEERDAELIRYPDVLDALKKLAGGDLWHEGVVELVSGGGRRSLRSRSLGVEGAGGAGVGEVAMEKEEVASDRESKGASSGSATTTTRSLRRRK